MLVLFLSVYIFWHWEHPIDEAIEKITMKGFKWDLEDYNMYFGTLISTSNEIVEDQVMIKSTNNFIFISSVEIEKLL